MLLRCESSIKDAAIICKSNRKFDVASHKHSSSRRTKILRLQLQAYHMVEASLFTTSLEPEAQQPRRCNVECRVQSGLVERRTESVMPPTPPRHVYPQKAFSVKSTKHTYAALSAYPFPMKSNYLRRMGAKLKVLSPHLT